MNKKHCAGCSNDFYNGKNNVGVSECWSLKTAMLAKRIPIGMQEPPPYLGKRPVTTPSCWHGSGSNRTLYVDPSRISEKGYWQ